MRITWVTRSFLDYRVPVYEHLNILCGGNLSLVYYGDVVPQRVGDKVRKILGNRAIPLSGEWRIGGKKSNSNSDIFSNNGIRIPIQPSLIKTVKDTDPDVIISDGFFQWTYSALYLRAVHKVPHVMCYERTAHTERNAQWYRKAYRKFVMRWIDAICCNGSLTGDYVAGLGFNKEKLTFGHMVADTEGLYEKVCMIDNSTNELLKKQLQTNGTVFLYVGRLIQLKGLYELMKSWAAFTTSVNKPATLILVGDGPQREELESYTQINNLENVKFVGKIDYDKIAAYYKLADIFIIPTLEDNWSLVVPEAMACGLPVMCSKYNGCHPELVTEKNGWVFDPLNNNDTITVLNKVIENKGRLAEMGKFSRKIIEFGHTPKDAAKSVYDACKMILKGKK